MPRTSIERDMAGDRQPALDPELAEMLSRLRAEGYRLGGLPVEDERISFRRLFLREGGGMAKGVSLRNLTIPGAQGALPARLYEPEAGPRTGGGALVYFHGGGGVLGDLDSYDAPCSHIAARAGTPVLSAGYRLAPEHSFPAGFEDAAAAVAWVFDQAGTLGFDPRRIAIGGDSQGATMAAVTAIRLKSRYPIAFQLLVYPGFGIDPVAAAPLLDGYFLDRGAIDFFLSNNGMRGHPRIADYSVAGQDLQGLPPAFVVTAEFDPAAAGARSYATQLRANGVHVSERDFAGLIHGFMNMAGASRAADAAITEIAEQLRVGLAPATFSTRK